jgi:mannose/fructose/N-acetylgalactosamine-specific phosphotransferase system component IIB
MSLIFLRIDDRLIHGQVVEGWLPILNFQEVIVVSRSISGDEIGKHLMRLSLPDKYKLSIMTPQEACDYLKNHENETRIMVLSVTPSNFVYMLENGLKVKKINIGGMHYSPGKIQLSKTVFIDDGDKQNFEKIEKMGIDIDLRGIPSDKPVDVMKLIRKLEDKQ